MEIVLRVRVAHRGLLMQVLDVPIRDMRHATFQYPHLRWHLTNVPDDPHYGRL